MRKETRDAGSVIRLLGESYFLSNSMFPSESTPQSGSFQMSYVFQLVSTAWHLTVTGVLAEDCPF